ncbi:ankyrin repeat and death domain-containing protein 1A isoform X2 [Fundulus heteroclitus]|uniref:ankyrin repeat and death domain-containing protein 1A isoform X2 n=1 Tax=Fundulus heteroclitus TaxID=8078 RepID=UPI00165CB5BC|nr:ankyrin repeat and death domain-containing protein 1A isoform X2 [Fundulus heteroclitus]
MERRVLAVRTMIKDHCPKKENLNLPKWTQKMGHDKPSDNETDGSFDTSEMLLDNEKQFMEAAKRNDVKTMKILGKSLNVNVKNVHHRTALHYAVAGKNKDATQFLLQRRVKVDQKDKVRWLETFSKRTTAQVTTFKHDCALWLWQYGMAAIHLAAWFGSLEMLKLLVQAGAEQKVENEEGLNIMHCAAINNHTEIIEYIVNDMQMKELDKDDQSGHRPFALAAEHGSVEMLKTLMEPYDMATMKPNKRGDTPLHLAARNGHLDAVQLLLQSFNTRDEVNTVGETALYQAAENSQEECVLALLEAGCDPNILTETKCSALHPVSERGDVSLVQLLLEHHAHTDVQNQLEAPLHLAVKNSHIPVIHCLVVAGCNVNIANTRLQTALHLSAELGRTEVVEMLLKAGVDLALRDRQGKTALGVAARANEVMVVDMIIKAERYYSWRKANPELNESVHSEHPLTFKLDHRTETKQLRSTAWRLAYELLKPRDWKRLAESWAFTKEQVSAVEDQWTGQQSYKEHGHRMLLIWLHGEELAQRCPSKQLYQELVRIGNRKAADKIRLEAEDTGKSCSVA